MENAQKHGSYSAKLQIQRDNLQKTKQILSKQFENKNLNEMDKRLILNNINNKYQQQIESIKLLKKQFESDNVEIQKQINIHDQLFEKLNTFPDAVNLNDYFEESQLQKHQKPQKQQKQTILQSQMQQESQNETESQENSEEKMEFEPDHRNNDINKTQTHSSSDLPTETETPKQPNNTDTQQQRQRDAQNPPYPPHPPHSQYQAPYSSHHPPPHPPLHYPPYYPPPYHPPYHHPHPPSYPHYHHNVYSDTNPMMKQLNEQYQITQKLLAQHEIESELLQQEIRNMSNKQENDKTKASQKEFQQTLHILKSKLINNNNNNNNDNGDDVQLSPSNHNESNEMNDFEKQERKLLKLIAKFAQDHDLKELYVEQLRSITSTKFELEKLEQSKKLEKLKHEVGKYKNELIAQSEHEQWLETQRRLLERKKIEKELMAHGITNRVSTHELIQNDAHHHPQELNNKLIPFTSDHDGFTIYFDFIMGFTQILKQCRLATSIINNTEIMEQTLQTTPWEAIYESNTKNTFVSMIQIPKFVTNLTPTKGSNYKLLIDVQVSDQDNNQHHYVWTIINDLFINDHNDKWCIAQGFWKLVLNTPPIMIQATTETMSQLTKSQNTLYFRILANKNNIQDLTQYDQNVNMEQLDKYKPYDPSSLIIGKKEKEETEERKYYDEVEEEEDDDNDIHHNDNLRSQLQTASTISTQPKPESRSSKSVSLYDEQNGIGVLVKFLEHQSKYPFAKIRISLRSMMDKDKNIAVWETNFAQEGLWKLAIYEWEQRHIFDNIPYQQDCFIIAELFENNDPNDNNMHHMNSINHINGSRPLTSLSSISNYTNKSRLNQSPSERKQIPTFWTFCKIWKNDEIRNKPIICAMIHELDLYKYPINLSNPISSNQDSLLSLQIFDPENAPIIKNVILTQQEMLDISAGNMNENGLDPIHESILDRPWIRIENDKNTTKVFDDGDGIDLYVDAARYLPQNVTITKLYVRLAWISQEDDEKVLTRDGIAEHEYCDISEFNINPIYLYRHEYRKEKFDAKCMFIFRIDTIEKYSGKCQIVGYSKINVFNDGNNGKDGNDANKLYLNEGAFQLPLFYTYINAQNIEQTAEKFEKLPCATLLIRIIKAPRSDDGTTVLSTTNIHRSEWNKYNLIQPAPTYNDGIYDTTYCHTTITELRLYNNLNEISNDKQISVILLENFKNEIDLDLNDEISDKEFNDFCDRKFKLNPKDKIQFIDLSYFCKYDPKMNMGFNISIDGINNIFTEGKKELSKDSLYIVIYTICPPSTYYEKDFKITDNVHFTDNWYMSSLSTSPCFVFEKFQTFKDSDFEFHKNAILLCDIREIRYKTNDGVNISDLQIIKYGFSFFPLFNTSTSSKDGDNDNNKINNNNSNDIYLKNGTFQNAIFKYPDHVQTDIDTDKYLKDLINKIIENGSKDIIEKEWAITKKQRKSMNDKLLKPMGIEKSNNKPSIIIRMYDNQRGNIQINKPIYKGLHIEKINTELIPSKIRNDYMYDPDQSRKNKRTSWFGSNKLKELNAILESQKILDQKSFVKKLKREIAKQLQIDI